MPDPTLLKLVEKQMRNWELSRAQRHDVPKEERGEVAPFITISRRPGSGGAQIALALGERLGWPVFGREILDHMAGDDKIRRQIYESMDERDLGWFEETMRSFMQSEFEKNDYFQKLTRTVLTLARQGSAVYLGRGCDLVLPEERGFRVRVVAGWDFCAQRLAAAKSLDIETASQEIQREEQAFNDYLTRHFHAEQTDETRYDLMLSVERFTFDQGDRGHPPRHAAAEHHLIGGLGRSRPARPPVGPDVGNSVSGITRGEFDMRIAFDIDDTITRHPEFFRFLSGALKAAGHQIFVITYREGLEDTEAELADYGIEYDELILATEEQLRDVDFFEWKAQVCRAKEIDVFFEDMPEVLNRLDRSTMACMVVDPDLGQVTYKDDD